VIGSPKLSWRPAQIDNQETFEFLQCRRSQSMKFQALEWSRNHAVRKNAEWKRIAMVAVMEKIERSALRMRFRGRYTESKSASNLATAENWGSPRIFCMSSRQN